jgi:predicted PolB exonuclease-like 3'-5' exonuclease
MSILYLDIETIPCNDEKVISALRESISPPANYSKEETIAKWMEQNAESELDKLVRKTSLDGLYGQILSIAWAIDDGEVHCVYRSSYDQSEQGMLCSFFESLYELYPNHNIPITKWVGHYISGFDLRFIWQRCVINEVIPLVSIPYNAKPWDSNVFDTKIAWTGASQYSGAGSLDKLSSVMFGEGKGEINGANVYDYFKRGEIDKIVEYNKRDVEMCRKLYKKMNFLPVEIDQEELA